MNNEIIQAFIDAWKQEFGEELTAEEARSEIDRLCTFFELLAEAENKRQADTESP